jgi:hypothetical protein
MMMDPPRAPAFGSGRDKASHATVEEREKVPFLAGQLVDPNGKDGYHGY